MTIAAATIAELEEIQGHLQRSEYAESEATKELRRIQEARVALLRKFEDKLKYATDPANAVVLGDRAFWMSGTTLCHINLKTPVVA